MSRHDRDALVARWAAWAREQEFFDHAGRPGVVAETLIRDGALYLLVQFRGERELRELRLVLGDERPPTAGAFVRAGAREAGDAYGWRPLRVDTEAVREPDARLVVETEAHTLTRATHSRRREAAAALANAVMEAIVDVVEQEPSIAANDDAVVRATAKFAARNQPALYEVVITVGVDGVDEPAVLAARQKVHDLLSRRDREAWDEVLAQGKVADVSATRFTLKTFVGGRPLPNLSGRLHLHAPRRK